MRGHVAASPDPWKGYQAPEPLPSGLRRPRRRYNFLSFFEGLDLQGGAHAVGVHRGPYDRLDESYRWLFGQWLPGSGREPADRPCHEIYVNDPGTARPQDLITHICVPLQPAGSP